MKNATATQLTPEIFGIFRQFIGQRSGIDYRNYYSTWQDTAGRRAYRQDARRIAQDGKRARRALALAEAYPFNPEALIDATRSAFSQRLQIVDTGGKLDLDYCTGQYFPTEYRAAAAVVLEWYCEAIRPKTISGRIPETITELKEANRAAGGHFFDRDTMRFFRSRVVPIVYAGPGGVYFVTSEQFDDNSARKFTVRKFDPATGDVDSVGGYCKFDRAEALSMARILAKTLPA